MEKKFTLGIIGGGCMGRAIAEGAVRCGFLAPAEVVVSEPDRARAESFARAGFFVAADNRAVAETCSYLLFAVKPQAFPTVAKELSGRRMPVVITIMAGRNKAGIRAALGGDVRIARAMPNLPCSVGEGATGLDASELTEEEREFVRGLFSASGEVVEVDEALLNAVTGISGSGPAYVYLFLQALTNAGTEQGLTREQAKALALKTVLGGARLAAQSDRSLNELIAAVSSKGGTTVAALESFEKDDFGGAVSRAVKAAVKRAEELSE